MNREHAMYTLYKTSEIRRVILGPRPKYKIYTLRNVCRRDFAHLMELYEYICLFVYLLLIRFLIDWTKLKAS